MIGQFFALLGCYCRKPNPPAGMNQWADRETYVCAVVTAETLAKIDPRSARRAAGSQNQLDRPASSSRVLLSTCGFRSRGGPPWGGFDDIECMAQRSRWLHRLVTLEVPHSICPRRTAILHQLRGARS